MADLQAVQVDFNIRYFRFAAREWHDELECNLQRLRRFKSIFSERAVAVFDPLAAPARRELAGALLHRGHPRAVADLREGLALPQEQLLEKWDAALLNSDDSPADSVGSTLRRAELAKDVRSRLAFLGEPERMDGGTTWRYRTSHAPYTLLTYVDCGGRSWDLSYHHVLFLGEHRLHRLISFLAWLGIGASKWSLRTAEDGEEAAMLLADLCSRFLSSLPAILPRDAVIS
jgi:hypothetical protein